MQERLKSQVERLLDEDSGRVQSVIVQMEEPDNDLQAFLEASTEAIRRRHLTLSAREAGPPDAGLIREKRTLTIREKRELQKSGGSITSQIALAAIQTVALATLRGVGLSALEPLMTSSVVQQAIASAVRRSRKKSEEETRKQNFRMSWSSRSALLKLTRDELNELPGAVQNISGIYPNHSVTLPPAVELRSIPQSISENSTSSWGVEKIGALATWGAYGTRGRPLDGEPPVKVAVLDTGVDPDHVELLGKVKLWAEFDENGAPVSSEPYDSGEHGTHVCGTIAGSNSEATTGRHPFIGVAPDVDLMVGLVLKGGTGTYFQILAGLDWAIENGSDIINMSLGGITFEPDVADVYTRAILNANRLGIPVVISIGNDGAQTSGPPGNDYFSFSVGATDYLDRSAGFSGGRTQIIRESRYIPSEYLPLIYSKPEVTAPGVAIRSCVPNGEYATWNGTSMAAPHVTGAIALLLAATDIRLVPAERRAFLLQELISSSVEELGEAGRDHRFGLGRINVLRAIAFAKKQGY